MRYDALYALKPLLAELSALTDELVEVEKIKIDDSDLECLRKKTGDRTITVYKELVKEAIKKDMKAVEAQIDEFVCVGVGHCRQLIFSTCCTMTELVLKTLSLRECDLSKEQRDKILEMKTELTDRRLADFVGKRVQP